MSRADWISAAVTLIVSAVGWFIGGEKAAIVCLAAGVLIAAIVHFTMPKEKVPAKNGPSNVESSFNPTISQIANPTINVNVGHLPPAATQAPNKREQNYPNIICLGARTVNISVDGNGAMSFHETREETSLVGVVACFRNDPIFGKTVKSVYNAKAHLKLIDSCGAEIGIGLSGIYWLGHTEDMIDLEAGGGSGCIVVLLSHNAGITVPWQRRKKDWQGVSLIDEALDLDSLPSAAEISLLDSNNQLLLPPILLELTSAEGKIQANVKQRR